MLVFCIVPLLEDWKYVAKEILASMVWYKFQISSMEGGRNEYLPLFLTEAFPCYALCVDQEESQLIHAS